MALLSSATQLLATQIFYFEQQKNKSLFYEELFSNNIDLVRQLFNADGLEFLTEFGIPVTPKEYTVVIQSPLGAVKRCSNTRTCVTDS